MSQLTEKIKDIMIRGDLSVDKAQVKASKYSLRVEVL